ncbi:hypothetical protein [Mycobacteroides sp. LB1]|uniref:hypothetical protein n=1 Tax=Mycobacteroides sp. LB1 TaxID=2750814 RepID=UPI002103395C
MPAQQPDYQGGNQPPLNQDNGVSIYNSGAPQAPQQGGQQGAQQQPGNQQPQHGTQIPDYQTATPYTQGPGKANPDYQAPQQNSPQQPQQQPTQQPLQGQVQQVSKQTSWVIDCIVLGPSGQKNCVIYDADGEVIFSHTYMFP